MTLVLIVNKKGKKEMIKEFFKKIFGIHNPSEERTKIPVEYHERDTRCDLCDNRGECEDYLIDCTRYEDTRRHVINGMGHICPKKYKGEGE